MMTVLEAQRILNDNDYGRVYTLEEAKGYLDMYVKLAEILEEHPIKKFKQFEI